MENTVGSKTRNAASNGEHMTGGIVPAAGTVFRAIGMRVLMPIVPSFSIPGDPIFRYRKHVRNECFHEYRKVPDRSRFIMRNYSKKNIF